MIKLFISSFLVAALFPVHSLGAVSESDVSLIGTFKNYAVNGGAENGKAGWTASGTSASAANLVVDTTNKYEGNAGFAWTPANADNFLTNTSFTITSNQGLSGKNCAATGVFKSSDGLHALEVYDGTNVIASVTIPVSTAFQASTVNFICPSSGSIRTRINAGSTVVLYMDSVRIGDALGVNISQVSQAQFVGSVKITGCAANWSGTSTTYADFATQTGCSYAVTGSLVAPSSNLPGFRLTSGPGRYFVVYNGMIAQTAANVNEAFFQLYDGTNSSDEESTIASGATAAIRVGANSWSLNEANAFTSLDFRIRYKVVSGATASIYGTTADPGNFSVYKFPTTSEVAYRPDQMAWKVDANISGASISLGTSSVSSYTEMTNGSLTLTQNTGSISTQIACASGTASTGTTCSVNESNGIAFQLPVAGSVLACVDFSHSLDVQGSGAIQTAFEIIETTNTSSAVVTEGNGRTSDQLIADQNNNNAGFRPTTTFPIRTCGVFNFSSSGQKTLRLEYEQLSSGTSPNGSTVRADADTSVGQRDVHWTVIPLNQSLPAPLLVGSVTSSSSGLIRVDGAAVNSSCTSSPCTITSSSSAFSSITRSSTGRYVANFNTGVFSTTPWCQVSALLTSGSTHICGLDSSAIATTTSFGIVCQDSSSGTNVDRGFQLSCMGAR